MFWTLLASAKYEVESKKMRSLCPFFVLHNRHYSSHNTHTFYYFKQTMTKSKIKNSNHIHAIIMNPRDIDILCGRGGGSNRHPGNKAFLKLVESKKSDYRSCRKTDKLSMAKSIVELIKSKGTRFLRKGEENTGWFEIDDQAAYLKTSQALREVPRKPKAPRRKAAAKRKPPVAAGKKGTTKPSSGGVAKARNQEAMPDPLHSFSTSSSSNSRMVRSKTIPANLCLSFTEPNQNGQDATGSLPTISTTNHHRPNTPRGLSRGAPNPSVGRNQTGDIVRDNSHEWNLFDFSNYNVENENRFDYRPADPTSLVRRSTPNHYQQLQTANNNLEWLLRSSSPSHGNDASLEQMYQTI